jgi:hypothetical protein
LRWVSWFLFRDIQIGWRLLIMVRLMPGRVLDRLEPNGGWWRDRRRLVGGIERG